MVRDFPRSTADADSVGRIVDALVASAADGTLSARPEDQPLGGRAVLALSSIEEIERPWDGLATPLLDELRAAYAAAPPDPWTDWATTRPAWVLARGLDTLLGQHSGRGEVDTFWAAIRHRHASFATAVIAALDRIDRDDVPALTRLVQLYADLDDIDDPTTWLAALRAALVADDFTHLPLSRA